MGPLNMIDAWPPLNSSAGWIDRQGNSRRHGESTRRFPVASITKALFAYGILIALEEGTISLDQAAGPPGSTVRHLLAHTSGLSFDDRPGLDSGVTSQVGQRRIYSNTGFEVLATVLSESSGIKADIYWREAVAEPLGLMNTEIGRSAAFSAKSSVDDLLIFAQELMDPTLISPVTLQEATSVQFPELSGVLPGFGQQTPNPWGLGFEIRGNKEPHWTGATNSPSTFGHFGAKGTMLWIDPELGLANVYLSDLDFGQWAIDRWPNLSDSVIEEWTKQFGPDKPASNWTDSNL